jgi:hypothetical protein
VVIGLFSLELHFLVEKTHASVSFQLVREVYVDTAIMNDFIADAAYDW